MALILVVVFSASFLAIFLTIYLIPSPYLHEHAYSTPALEWSSDEIDTGNHIGPALNATNVPLDTTIVVDLMRPMEVRELQLSPEAPIARRVDEYYPVASQASIFYFSELLKPATTYNATLFVNDKPISWNFTTTAKPYYPRYEAMPSLLGIFAAITVSTAVTLIIGLIIWKKRKRA